MEQQTRAWWEDAIFPVASGKRYMFVLSRLHEILKPNWYLEVGTFQGASLSRANCASIAVDPNFAINKEIVGKKPQLHCLSMTSDAFFESNFVSAINAKIDLAFLDGMHLFEFILRDVMNCEKVMSPSGTIVLHDVIPIGYLATRRQWDRDATNAWTGDVWKVLPALRKYRPDLDITVLDAAPSGMAIIRKLDPSSTTLDTSFDDIVAEFADFDLQPDNIEAITKELEIVNALGFLAALETVQNTNVRVTVHIPPRRMGERFYAESLGAAFQRAGVPAVVLEHDLEPKAETSDALQEGTSDGEIAIVLRGKRPPSHPKASKSILWVQSQADSVTDAEMDDYDHVCWASSSPPKRDTKATQSTLLQCTDTTIFHKARHIERRIIHKVLFVGSCYATRRSYGMVRWAIDAGIETAVYGMGWEDRIPTAWWQAESIKNARLGDLYRSAGVVLNDHHKSMRGEKGFVNNRVYDALACGVPLISDPIDELPSEFKPFVYIADGPEALREAVDAALNEDENMRLKRFEFAKEVEQAHSFDVRAAELIKLMRSR